MEWVVWYGIVLIILIGVIIGLILSYKDVKRDSNFYEKHWLKDVKPPYKKTLGDNIYGKDCIFFHNGDGKKLTIFDMHKMYIDEVSKHNDKEYLEKQLADIKYAEKHQLAIAIEESTKSIIEFFVDGKSIGRWAKDDAVKYSKSHLKQNEKEWLRIEDGMFRVKRLKTKDLVG